MDESTPPIKPEKPAAELKESKKTGLIQNVLRYFKKIWPYEKKEIGILIAVVILIIVSAVGVLAANAIGQMYFKSPTVTVKNGSQDNTSSGNQNESGNSQNSSIGKGSITPTTKIGANPTIKPGANTPTPSQKLTATPTSASTLDKTPPVITSITGPDNGSTVDFNSFCFPIVITDNVSNSSNLTVRVGFDSSLGSYSNNFSPCYSNIGNGSHTFTAQAKDAAGNESTVVTRTFSVNQASDIPVTVTAVLYQDVNCNGVRDSGESNITSPATTAYLFQMPGTIQQASSSSPDGNGTYTLTTTIKSNQSVNFEANATAPSGYSWSTSGDNPQFTLDHTNTSKSVELPMVPYANHSACSIPQ